VASLGRLNFAGCVYGGVCIVLGILYIYMLTAGQKRAVAKLSNQVCRPGRVTITDRMYVGESDLERVEVRWPALVKIEDTAEFFVLYRAKRLFILLRKRAFDAAQVAELSAFLPACTSGQKPLVHDGRPPVPAAAGGVDTRLTAQAQDSQLSLAEHGDQRPARSAE
jgi:hypothetical protein